MKQTDQPYKSIPVAQDLHNTFDKTLLQSAYDSLMNTQTGEQQLWNDYIRKLKHKQRLEQQQNLDEQETDTIQFQGKPKLELAPQIGLQNVYNFNYYGPIFMGSNSQQMNVVFDTTSDWLVVESTGCKTCAGKNYNIGSSRSYKQTTNRASYHFYGKAGLLGYNSTDDVYLDPNMQLGIPNFLWFLVIDQQGIGRIDNNVFSFNIANEQDQSYVEIGAYSVANMRNPKNLMWLSTEPSFFWIANINGFKLGTSGTYSNFKDSTFTHETYPGIFDTGSSFLYVPRSIGVTLISKILRGQIFSHFQGLFLVSCDKTQFLPISLLIDNLWLEISPETYIVNIQQNPDICALGIQINSDENYILGNVFLRNYYAIFDMSQNKIGLTPQLYSNVADIEFDNDNTQSLTIFNETFFYWMGIIWDIIVIIAILGVINYFIKKSRNDNS
eukprot:403338231